MVRVRQTIDGNILDEPIWNDLINANRAFRDSDTHKNRGNLYVSLVNYLNWVIAYCNDELHGKEYRDEQVIQKVFITKATKENQVKEYLKYSLVPLREYASHLLHTLRYENLHNYFTLIMTLLEDAGVIVKEYEVRCKRCEAFLLPVGGRKTMMPYDILNASAELFNIESMKTIKELSVIDLKPNVMFQIRQLLEIVGKNLIGFDSVVDNAGKPIHQFTQVAWTFLSSVKSDKWSIKLPYSAKDIFAVNSWTNSFVHTTYFNTCYLQYFALRIIQTLMKPVLQESIFGTKIDMNIGKP